MEIARQVTPDHPALGYALHDLGRLLLSIRRTEEAEPLLQETLDIRRKHLPPDSRLVAESQVWLGAARTAQGRFDEAEELLQAGHGKLVAASDPRAGAATQYLVELYQAWNRPEQAAKCRSAG